jgi:hypothetical protein
MSMHGMEIVVQEYYSYLSRTVNLFILIHRIWKSTLFTFIPNYFSHTKFRYAAFSPYPASPRNKSGFI